MYREYTVMQPLQRSYAITEERIEAMLLNGTLNNLYDEVKVREYESQGVAISDADQKKLDKLLAGKPTFDLIVSKLKDNMSDKVFLSPKPFLDYLSTILDVDKKLIEKVAYVAQYRKL